MKTLEQFQNEVLKPIRIARDNALALNRQKTAQIEKAFSQEKLSLIDARKQFEEDQRNELAAFILKQRRDLGNFCDTQKVHRATIHCIHHDGITAMKAERRNINETFSDQIALAFAKYNEERRAAGLAPLQCDYAHRIIGTSDAEAIQ